MPTDLPDLDAIEQRLKDAHPGEGAGHSTSCDCAACSAAWQAGARYQGLARTIVTEDAPVLLQYARDMGALLVNIEAASDECPVCERAAQADGSHAPGCELARLIGAKRAE